MELNDKQKEDGAKIMLSLMVTGEIAKDMNKEQKMKVIECRRVFLDMAKSLGEKNIFSIRVITVGIIEAALKVSEATAMAIIETIREERQNAC